MRTFCYLAVAASAASACCVEARVRGEQPLETPAGSAVVIDAGRIGEPIHPFIYGQFIEHLGRCIYGGIWAEMLEDRKFYFPITAEYDPYRASRDIAKDAPFPVVGASPWQIVGSPESVTMTTEDSFVGDLTPLIAAGGGIRQKDLGLVKGKTYVGHVWVRAAGRPAKVAVSLLGAEGRATIEAAGGDYVRGRLQFRAEESTDKGELEIDVRGGPCYVGAVSLMPADNVQGMRADTLEVLKTLGATIYRWPGGNFVSGYDWRDGIGDRDRRPPRRNPAWTGVEHNDFGVDEFLAFCREVDAEPLISVNTGMGDAYSAAQEVEYCNGSPDTIAGKWRAENGRAQPYGVRWWCVGNEMYGRWQLGHMALRHYTFKHNQVADAMRKVDPRIKLIAVGALGRVDPSDPNEKRGWSRGMLEECADRMDWMSEHFYCGAKDDLLEHVRQIPDRIREKAEGHRKLRQELPQLQGKDIRIALDEWNYWHRPYLYGELGCRYRLRDALGIAAGLHEYYRNSDIISMANYAQTVNVIGCVKTTKTAAGLAATGAPLQLYRRHFGVLPVKVASQGPLDVMAALTEDRKRLTIGVVNPTLTAAAALLQLNGATQAGGGVRWRITGDGPMAYNEPGKAPNVKIDDSPLDGPLDAIRAAPCSITLYSLNLN